MNIRAIINNVSCFVLILILSFIFLTNTVSAETRTFIKEYTYQASEYDSKVTCRLLALEQVKRLLLEEPQENNRFRFWGSIPELEGYVLRVITLSDKKTIHNAFPDRRFKP